jgi:hypothetical protein
VKPSTGLVAGHKHAPRMTQSNADNPVCALQHIRVCSMCTHLGCLSAFMDVVDLGSGVWWNSLVNPSGASRAVLIPANRRIMLMTSAVGTHGACGLCSKAADSP